MRETGGLELASTITLVLQANRLTKCASHPKPFLDDNSTLSCDCTSSPFVYQDHSHIIRGNLKIIDNNKLRKPFSKRPKYRENGIVEYQKASESIITGIKACIQSSCDKHGFSTSFFEWREAEISAINERIDHLMAKLTTEK